MAAKAMVLCRTCGVEFNCPRSHQSPFGNHCSKACYNASRRVEASVVCEVCGKTVKRKPSQIKLSKRHFCSPECRAVGTRNRIRRECEWCGKVLERIPGWQNDRHFCSRSCAGHGTQKIGPENRNWKGGHSYTQRRRGSAWKKAVKQAAGKACQVCGAKNDLHAHHILPYADYPEHRYDLSNGVCLCASCHKAVHGWKALQGRLALEV